MKIARYWWLLLVLALTLGGLLWQGQATPPRPARARARPQVTVKRAALPRFAVADSYRLIRERNLFQPLVIPPLAPRLAAAPLPALSPAPLPPVTPTGSMRRRWQGREQAQPEMPTSDDWTYAGYALVDEVPVAFLERAVSKEAMFLRVGDTSPLGQVTQITSDEIVIGSDGGEIRLACSDTFVATPLNAVQTQRQGRAQQQDRRPGGLLADPRALLADPRAREFLSRMAERLGLSGGGPSPFGGANPQGGQ